MLGRLKAEEAMHTANQIGVGTGSLERAHATALIDGWKRSAVPPRPQTMAEVLSVFAKQGVGVRLVPKKPTASAGPDGH